jgi:SpoVK/Ycf46/Vps4 family AAA+-type ATPase
LNVGSLKGKYVGETEANTKKATNIIDAFGRCVVIIDEIEKFFGGSGKGLKHSTDESMLGFFLTWMQDRRSEAIVIATSNRIDLLPAEFVRSGGRWDTVFFFDLPNPTEIKSIIDIKNKQYNSEIPNDNTFCEKLYSEKWSGAEIEQLAKDSHYEDSIENAMKYIPVLAQYRSEEIETIRNKSKMYRRANESVSVKQVLNGIKKRTLKIKK